MNCPQCNYEVDEGEEYCPNCNAELAFAWDVMGGIPLLGGLG